MIANSYLSFYETTQHLIVYRFIEYLCHEWLFANQCYNYSFIGPYTNYNAIMYMQNVSDMYCKISVTIVLCHLA